MKISDDMVLEYERVQEDGLPFEEFDEGEEVVVRILTQDVLLDDIEESDFEGVIKDIKKRDMYYDVYIEVNGKEIISSTSKIHHVGETTGIWIKPEKVMISNEREEEESE